MIFMGGHFDKLIAGKLPSGADIKQYTDAPAGSEFANALAEAKKAAGPEILNATLMIPLVLIIVFAGLFFYMRGKKKQVLINAATS